MFREAPQTGGRGFDTILNLFDGPATAPTRVDGLTGWDVSCPDWLCRAKDLPVQCINPGSRFGVMAAYRLRERQRKPQPLARTDRTARRLTFWRHTSRDNDGL